jgi:hypothetical protein
VGTDRREQHRLKEERLVQAAHRHLKKSLAPLARWGPQSQNPLASSISNTSDSAS